MAVLGISQAELARRIGVSQPTINNLINRSKKGSTHLHKVARELGTTPAYLTGETDDPFADAPDAPQLTSEESELLLLFRRVEVAERGAAIVLLRGCAKPSDA